MPEPCYIYRAVVSNVVDGDTFDLMTDLGFHSFYIVRVRLHGIDTPERNTAEGKAATAAVAKLLEGPLVLKSYKNHRTFERWECEVWREDGTSLAEALTEAGFIKHPTQLTIERVR